MNTTRTRVTIIRYICLMGVIALGLFTIIGCDGGGGGSTIPPWQPQPGYWSDTIIEFFVSQDSSKLTAPSSRGGSLILGPLPYSSLGCTGSITLTYDSDILINNKNFSLNTVDFTVNGTFDSSSTSSGSYSFTGTTGCGAISLSGNWSAVHVLLSSISVTPANPSKPAGTTQQFTATGMFSNGKVHDMSYAVDWSSSNTSVATINNNGLATAVAAGTATITATSGSISGTTTLIVDGTTLNSITVTPALPTIPQGFTQQLAAAGYYSDGTSHDITTQVTWSSLNPSVATVNSSGLATAVATGQATITATSGGKSSNIILTVTPSTVLYPMDTLTRCGTLPPGAYGMLCPTDPVISGSVTVSFSSSTDWATTLTGNLVGTGYGINLKLANQASGYTATAQAQIIIKRGTTETPLFTSRVVTVNSSTFASFTDAGTGISANGVAGDELILRVSCLSGCSSPSGLSVLITVPATTSYIAIP